ncbi:hypothetical protein [Thiolinea disciformis]|uniref:hypothetical protein n=1 Tax=Thiolinea disciformis TaxID=125614 RepID=UPI0003781513|nr:hypothetical protein [Thiolinea disciformis]
MIDKKWLEVFGDRLDKNQLQTMLEKAKAELRQSYPELQQCLQQADWEQAAYKSHKIISLVNLLDMHELFPYLIAIEKRAPKITTLDFRAQLDQQYQQCLATIA